MQMKVEVSPDSSNPEGTAAGGSPGSVELSSFDNSWYKPGSALKRSLWYLCNTLLIKSYIPYPTSLKRYLLTLFGASLGRNVVIKPGVNIKYPWFLDVGSDVWIGEGVWIDNLASVKIGSNVCLSQGAYILTGNHDYKKKSFDLIVKSVVLDDGVWVGAKTVVCPGVTMKTHAVLTAGSVATKDADAYTIYAGNPAAPVRQREIS